MKSLTIPESNQVYLVIGGHTAASRLLDLAPRLALRGPLLLLDCGNRANPLPIVRELRHLTADPVRVLGSIQSARAFTCYQVTALLETAATQPVPSPVLIIDLLATFYDENVSFRASRHLLEQCLRSIHTMRQSAPVVISCLPPPEKLIERAALLQQVCELAGDLWIEDTPVPRQPPQPSLLD